MKTKYRSKIQIASDVLNVLALAEEDVIISQISTKCNLSHYATREVLKSLEKAGLVILTERIKDDGHYTYKTIVITLTPKGHRFLKLIKEFIEIFTEAGLL